MSQGSGSGLMSVIIAVVLATCLYKGVFYQTGSQWHEACWYAQHSEKGPKTPEEAAQWSQCGVSANRAFYNAGMMMTYRKPVTPVMQAIDQACPSSQFTMVNLSSEATESITAKGGPDIWDKLLPASWTLDRTFNKLWPKCSAVRAANGIPLMVEQKNSGWFDWAAKCGPCEAEEKAIAAQGSGSAAGPYTLLTPNVDQATPPSSPQ